MLLQNTPFPVLVQIHPYNVGIQCIRINQVVEQHHWQKSRHSLSCVSTDHLVHGVYTSTSFGRIVIQSYLGFDLLRIVHFCHGGKRKATLPLL